MNGMVGLVPSTPVRVVRDAKPTPFLRLDQRATIGVAFRSRRDAPAILNSPPPSFVVAMRSPHTLRIIRRYALEFRSLFRCPLRPFLCRHSISHPFHSLFDSTSASFVILPYSILYQFRLEGRNVVSRCFYSLSSVSL